MIVSSFISLVSKEINLIIFLEESQAISLVPSYWEHIKTDLATNGIFDSKIRELFQKYIDEFLPDKVFFIVLFEIIPFSLRTVSTNGRDVDKSCPVFNKGAPLDRNIDIGKVVKAKSDELFQLSFSQEIFD